MSIIERIRNRRAIRNYQQQEVEKEKIETLLEAATWAPNDRMREPWSFYVFQGEAKEKYVALAHEFLQERFPTKPALVESSLKVVNTTPVIIVVTSDIVSDDEDASIDNEYAVSCAIYAMWLTAKELGLGMVWRTRGVGLARDQRLYELIGSPENKKIVGSVFIGYPEDEQVQQTTVPSRTSFEDKTIWL